MATRIFLLLTLALTAIRCPAQPTITPYAWTTIAGYWQDSSYGCGSYGDGTNDSAGFGSPAGVAVDRAGNLYVADMCKHVIRKVTPAGANRVVTTLAGLAGSSGWADGTGNTARFNNPTGVAVDSAGNVYVADRDNHTIRQVTPGGVVTTLAGNPLTGFGYANGTGSAARFSDPTSVTVDTAGNLYVADHQNNTIRKMTLVGTDWQVTTLAGSTNRTGPGAGQGTDPETQLNLPVAVAVDGAGYVYVADYWSDTIRQVTPAGVVTRWAGHFVVPVYLGHYGNADGTGPEAQFNYPMGLAVDGAGNVYVADTQNSEIRKVTPQGVVTTLGGESAFNGWGNPVAAYQDGTGSTARFFGPTGVAVDSAGNLYVADNSNYLIRKGVAPVVQVVALEVTQVIQDWSNSIPLIQGKATYVRAHLQLPPKNSGPVTVAGARLYGSGVNGPLPGSPTFPINKPDASLTVQATRAANENIRGQFANSLNFQLPPEWLSGTNTLQLAWGGGLQPTNVVPNDCTVRVTFVPAPEVEVHFVGINLTNANGTPCPVDTNRVRALEPRLLSCYPVAHVNATFQTMSWPTNGQPQLIDVLGKLWAMRGQDVTNFRSVGADVGNRIYYGALPLMDPGTELLGLAYLPGSISSGFLPKDPSEYGEGRTTHAHEIAHALGLDHDVRATKFGFINYWGSLNADGTTNVDNTDYAVGPCDEEGNFSSIYPLFQFIDGYWRPALGPMTNGDNSIIYGLDTVALRTLTNEPVADPSDYFDLMGYCSTGSPLDKWVSSFTYLKLLTNINATFGLPSPALPAGPVPQGGGGGGNYLIVRGSVSFSSGTAQFLPCLALSTINAPPAPPPGTNFLLQALDSSDVVLQEIQFDVNPIVIEQGATSRTGGFFVPLDDDPSIHTILLWSHGMLLAALEASPHAPTVTVASPHGGENFATGPVNVAWSGNDADADPLTYTVQYSPDNGASWHTLEVDWPGQSLEIPSSELAATTRGLMRVIASDGFNTTAAQSAATFTVQPHAPRVSINAPRDGEIFMADQQLFLDASADDMQDGALKGKNVQWSSNLDGPLGQGDIVTFNAKKLSEGYHTITVTAIDSAGLTNSAVTHLLELHYTPPQLSITLTPGVPGWFPPYWTLSWPSYYTNYVLQSSANLTSGWAAVTNPPPSGNEWSEDVGVGGARSFFRLVFQP